MNDAALRAQIRWHARYRPEWDATPARYSDAGVVPDGKLRRLGQWERTDVGAKAYLGVQAYNPARWGLPGERETKFFVSLFLGGRTVAVRAFPTLADALATLADFAARIDRPPEG